MTDVHTRYTDYDKNVIDWAIQIEALGDQSEMGNENFIASARLLKKAYSSLVDSGWSKRKAARIVCDSAESVFRQNKNFWAWNDRTETKRGRRLGPNWNEEAEYKLFIDVTKLVDGGKTANAAIIDVAIARGARVSAEVDSFKKKYYSIRKRYDGFENLEK